MTTVPENPVSKPSSVLGALLMLVALATAGLMAALSLWLMPFAGLTLVTVGWLGLTRGVPRGLAYVVMAVGVLMLAFGVLAFAPV